MDNSINSLGLTIYDNKPNSANNSWYQAFTTKEEHKSRFTINFTLYTDSGMIPLKSQLMWPPSQFRTRQLYKNHPALYQQWIEQATKIQLEARGGRLDMSIPPLLGILHQNKTIKTSRKWLVPKTPSIIQALRLKKEDEYYWQIKWIWETGEETFYINNDNNTTVKEVENKFAAYDKSISLNRYYNEKFNIPYDVYKPSLMDTQSKTKINDGYTKFKAQLIQLLALPDNMLITAEIQNLCAKNPDYMKLWDAEHK